RRTAATFTITPFGVGGDRPLVGSLFSFPAAPSFYRLYGMGCPRGDGRTNRSPSYGFSPISRWSDCRCLHVGADQRELSHGRQVEANTTTAPKPRVCVRVSVPHGNSSSATVD